MAEICSWLLTYMNMCLVVGSFVGFVGYCRIAGNHNHSKTHILYLFTFKRYSVSCTVVQCKLLVL
jgi:hypothetical protein